MDIKTAMALRNYGINPLTQNGTQKPSQQQQPSFEKVQSGFKEGIDFTAIKPDMVSAPQGDFSSMMKNIAQEAVSTVRNAEKTAIDGLNNKVDAQSVVEAMSEAEMTIRTATAVRDKVIEAYQEILRMPI